MKPILFSILFLLVPKLVVSQVSDNDKLIYLDSTWSETTKENHKYYRITKDYHTKSDLYKIKEYYKSGAIRTEGFSKNKDKFEKEGELTLYFENGNKYKICHYLNARLIGKEFEWYENGNKKREIEYTPTEKESQNKIRIIQYWNKDNVQTVVDGNGNYEESYKEFYSAGKLRNGYKDGIWEGYDKKIGYTFSENYEDKKFISGVSIDNEKIAHNYTIIDKKPDNKEDIKDFYYYFAKNFHFPYLANGVGGKFYLKFTIDINGNIIEPSVLKSIGYNANKEAIRVLLAYKKFTPREIRGIKTKYTYTLPISLSTAGTNNSE